jgi:hypothetical protein
MKPDRAFIGFCLSFLILSFAGATLFSASGSRKGQVLSAKQPLKRDLELASLFAPVFYQALGEKPRSDYITNFDFDGDWRGDNNWNNAENDRFPLKAYVYYSVSETSSHLFIHYAVFHPRDYKGGERKGAILSELMREGAKRGSKYDPTGLAEETALAHENDMEGCLIVAAKRGNNLSLARVIFVETLHHNLFSKYLAGEAGPRDFGTVKIEGQRVLLYVEPKGHGIQAYDGGEKQTAKKRLLVYRFAGKAEEPKENEEDSISYDLVPIQSTLWSRARMQANSQVRDGKENRTDITYGAFHDYGQVTVNVLQPNGRAGERKITVGKLGFAFLGKVGGQNMARPPWGWFDRNTRDEPLGLWFFDPAKIIKRDFKLDRSFSTTYARRPFWAAD